MAQAADQRTPKTLDDAARFLIEERGYEKNPALCWEILEQIWAGRIKLRRHWKKYDLNGNPQEDGAEVVNRAVFRSRNLDFDRHGHIRLVPEWGDDRYTIVEPCDFWIIWPAPAQASQTAPEQQPADKAGPDPFKTGAAGRPSAADFILTEAKRRIADKEVTPRSNELTAFSENLEKWWNEKRLTFNPPGPPLKAGSIKNVVRKLWNEALGARN